jgi:Signal peptidase subunit
MHTLKNRIVRYFTTMSMYSLALAGAIFASSFLMNMEAPECNLALSPLRTSLRFTPNLNLEKQFNYNTREIYLYLVQEDSEGNQYVLWDELVRPWGPRKFYSRVENEYKIRSPLRGSRFFLRGNYIPYFGIFKNKTFGTAQIQ